MSYFNLRKHETEPETEPVEEDVDEVEEESEEPVQEAKERTPPESWGGALWYGISGPTVWIYAHTNIEATLLIHAFLLWAGAASGWAATGILTGWLIAVLAFIPREHLERAAAALEQDSGRAEEKTPAAAFGEPLFDPLTAVLWGLIGDAPGAHLKTLTEHLRQAAPEQPLDRGAVRAKLTALGIPLRGSVRDASGRVNEGVHRDDLAAWQEPLLAPFLGAPPEARSGPVATALTSSVGKRRARVATPLSALRRLLLRGVR